MNTYQIRERVFRVDADLVFPNDVAINIVFHENTAFGNIGAPGRTWKRATPGGVIWDSNTGHFRIDPESTIEPLDVTIENSNMIFCLKGNELKIETHSETNGKLTSLLESLYYVFPFVLGLVFRDTVTIERVSGSVGEQNFRWELTTTNIPIVISEMEQQESSVIQAWDYMSMLSKLDNRRVIAALKYYHTACRLARVGNSPWEFMSEIVLNLCKVLESLFPASRDSVREGLLKLNYTSEEIEKYFIPIMLLRSKVDSGHVFLSLFTRSELNSLHSFTEIAESKWHEMLERLFLQLQGREITITEYEADSADTEAKGIIETMRETMEGRYPNPEMA
jgi:hypothetical protein